MTRQALHAFSLSFDHPSTGKKLSFLADLPEDFKDMLTKAGLSTSLPSV
jgi:23S rRNA pseudouridine1911/1915/1917 synthase